MACSFLGPPSCSFCRPRESLSFPIDFNQDFCQKDRLFPPTFMHAQIYNKVKLGLMPSSSVIWSSFPQSAKTCSYLTKSYILSDSFSVFSLLWLIQNVTTDQLYIISNISKGFFFFFLSLDLVPTSTASMEKIKPIGCSGSPLFCPALHLELNSHRFESLPQNRVSSCGAARAGLVHWEALMLSEVISVPIQNFLCFS